MNPNILTPAMKRRIAPDRPVVIFGSLAHKEKSRQLSPAAQARM